MQIGEIRYENADIKNRYGIINSHRPCVIVAVGHGETVQVVPLTTSENRKADACCTLTHIPMASTGKDCTAMCEQVRSANTKEIGALISYCSNAEMRAIQNALRGIFFPSDMTTAVDTDEGKPRFDTKPSITANLEAIANLAKLTAGMMQ